MISIDFSVSIAFIVTSLIAILVVFASLALRHALHESILSPRKFLHIAVGPVFLLCIAAWPHAGYKQRHDAQSIWNARLAALIPALSGMMFWVIGSGKLCSFVGRKTIMPIVDAVSRTGSLAELQRGPTIYGLIIGLCTLLCFTYSPVLVILVSCLSIGDGFAESAARIGEKCGVTTKLPWNPNKSFAGSFGFLITSLLSCYLLGQYYMAYGCWDPSLTFSRYLVGAAVSCVISMLVETLPIEEIDNLTVGLTAIITSSCWFAI